MERTNNCCTDVAFNCLSLDFTSEFANHKYACCMFKSLKGSVAQLNLPHLRYGRHFAWLVSSYLNGKYTELGSSISREVDNHEIHILKNTL